MEGSSEPPAQSDAQSLTHREVDGLLLSSKKIRYRNRKACYPCNKRKIKCDRDEQPTGQPCTNCRKRPHPELCSYEDHNPRSSGGSTRSINHHSQPATPSQQRVEYTAAPTPQVQPLLPGIHAVSASYEPESGYQDDQPSVKWHTPVGGNYQSSFETVPLSSRTTGRSSMPGPNHHSVETPTQPAIFAAPHAEGTLQTPNSSLWEEINSLLPPQKHILR